MNHHYRTSRAHRSAQLCPHPRRPLKIPSVARRMRVYLRNNDPTPTHPWLLPRQSNTQLCLFTDLPAHTGTPSPASSSSSCMVMTPTSSHHHHHHQGQQLALSATQFRMAGHETNSTSQFMVHPEEMDTEISWPQPSISNIRKQPKPMSIPTWDDPTTDLWWDTYEPTFHPTTTHDTHDNFHRPHYPYPKQTIPHHRHHHHHHHSPTTHHHVAALSATTTRTYPAQPVSQSASRVPSISAPSMPNQLRPPPPPVLHQPQPIRPIPLIPLSRFSSTLSHHSSPSPIPGKPSPSVNQNIARPQVPRSYRHKVQVGILPEHSLLYQPAPDSVRFQYENDQYARPVMNPVYPPILYHQNKVPKGTPSFSCACGCLGSKHSLTVNDTSQWYD